MTSKIIKYLLLLLGFGAAGCEHEEDVAMYGVPTVDYRITGRIVDEESNPIKGIRITTDEYTERGNAGVLSDDYGVFVLRDSYIGHDVSGKGPFVLRISDLDGEDNGGKFAGRDFPVYISKSDFTDESEHGWVKYYSVDAGDIILEKEEQL